MEMQALWNVFTQAFVTLFVILDAVALAPIFAGLTEGADTAHKRAMATKGVLVAGGVLAFFATLGAPFMKSMGISMDALRIAGGGMLFLIGLEMVFEKRTPRKQNSAEHMQEDYPHEDISVVPLAIPLISGPGAIATIMLLMANEAGNPGHQAAIGAALLINLVILWGVLMAAGFFAKLLGKTVAQVLTRVLGIVLAAMAMQFLIDGIKGAFGL